MNIPFITLIGFAFTTICTSICPMGMNMDMEMMSMPKGDMQMMHEGMAHKGQSKTPCEKCNHSQEQTVAIGTSTIKIQASVNALFSVVPSFVHYKTVSLKQPARLLHAHTRPPPLAQSLVGTVILRT